MPFEGSYLWELRQKVGNDLVLMPGASVVVENAEGQVLLVLRSDTHEWCLPAGAAEKGDNFARTAINELKEEAGLEVQEANLVAFGSLSDPRFHTVHYPNGDVTHCFAVCFLVREWSGNPRHDGEEMIDLTFADTRCLPSPMHQPSAKILELYERYKETHKFQIC